MRRTLFSVAFASVALTVMAQTKVSDRVTVNDLDSSRLHVCQSGDSTTYYTHFAPVKAHLSPMQISSPESVDALLAELYKIKESGAIYVFGSHGEAASQEDVAFQIEYLEKIKSLTSECKSSDIFGQRLMVAYTSLPGVENIKAIAKALYPGEVESPEKSAVRSRVEDYLNMVSSLDMEIAKGLWAERDDISIITPRTQFFGFYDITQNFLIKTFSSLQSRKLHTLSEAINVNGDSANVQLYWVFDTVDAGGEAHQTRGRESLIFEKISGEWRLVHVHYSRLM